MNAKPHTATGYAHGKIILMGEHAVVYGEPALALPFPAATVQATVTESPGPARLECQYFNGELSLAPDHLENIQAVIQATAAGLGLPLENLIIKIDSTIPAERGMGSSAAVAAAVVRALYHFAGGELEKDKLLELIHVAEVIAHGNPSGLDALMTSSDTPVYYKKQHPFEPFPLRLDAYLVVGDTGQMGQTKQAVGDIALLKQAHPEQTTEKITQLGQFAENSKQAITDNQPEQLGEMMTNAHKILAELTVSNEKLDQLVEKALDTDALGAKLTGGGRGGCMIALARTKEDAERISKALVEAGAENTWIHSLGGDSND